MVGIQILGIHYSTTTAIVVDPIPSLLPSILVVVKQMDIPKPTMELGS